MGTRSTGGAGVGQESDYVYAGNAKAITEAPTAVVDGGSLASLRFADVDKVAKDAGGAPFVASAPIPVDANGLIGPSARFDGTQVLEFAANDKLQAASAGAYSISLCARPNTVTGTLFTQGLMTVELQVGKVPVTLGTLKFVGGDLPPSAWVHIGLTLGAGKWTLYINGAQPA